MDLSVNTRFVYCPKAKTCR